VFKPLPLPSPPRKNAGGKGKKGRQDYVGGKEMQHKDDGTKDIGGRTMGNWGPRRRDAKAQSQEAA